MAHSEKLNQERLESLQMSNFDLSRTEWMGQFGSDVLILHNPHFTVNWEPYRMKYVLVAVCNEGSGFGAVNLRSFRLHKNSLLIVLGQGDAYLFYKNAEHAPFYQLDEGTAAALRSCIDLLHKLLQIQPARPNMEEALQLLNRLFFLMIGWVTHASTAGNEAQLREETKPSSARTKSCCNSSSW